MEGKAQDTWLFGHGQTLDHFRVLRPLGKGGMAQVFLARDTKLGRKVALKVVQPEALGSEDAKQRFLFEARATARFNHPHIVTIHFVGEADGKPYVALEYVEGQTLRERLEQGPVAVAEAIRLGQAVVAALAEAHAAGIIHRDLKPENVMLGRDGRLRVMDFGLARVASAAAEALAETVAPGSHEEIDGAAGFASQGGLRGTPAYMAPEQWREQAITGATDIWALGVMLYELLAGQRPYGQRSPVKQALVVCESEPVPDIKEHRPDVPERLAALVQRCLEKDASRRPAAQEVAAELGQLLLTGPAREQDASPFRGLLPFGEEHAALYFGREAEVTAFVERLREEAVLPVVGPSGSGKSSFVRAGVIPRLREAGPLTVVRLRPGASPLATLASQVLGAKRQSTPSHSSGRLGVKEREVEELVARLREAPELLGLLLEGVAEVRGGQVLLFVDQVEEVFTLVDDEAEQRVFVRAVCAAADDPTSPVRVVLTLREEFFSRLAGGLETRQSLRGVTVLRRPGAEALEQILVRQAETAGYRFEDEALPREMVSEVAGEVSCLPLLQFAGERMWESRDRSANVLVRRSYEGMGGVAGALAQHADGVLSGLSDDEVRLCRSLLLRLVTSEGTRRVVSRAAALEGLGAGADDVLDRLTDARLVTAGQAKGEAQGAAELELVHETLVSTWGRLRRWIEESREELVFLEEVGQAAELWDRRGRRDEEVWHGDALRDAQRAIEHCTSEVPDQVRRFIGASEERAGRLQRRRRRLWIGGMVGLAIVALVSVIAAFTISGQKRQVDEQRARAVVRQAEAEREAARGAMLRGEMLEARGRLRVSLEAGDSPVSRGLWGQLARKPLLWKLQLGCDAMFVDLSPDGKTIGHGCDKMVQLTDARTGKVRRILKGHTNSVNMVTFSPDGRQIASISCDETLRIWDVDTGEQRQVISGVAAFVGVVFSPDGALIATGDSRFVINLFDTKTGRRRRALSGHQSGIPSLSFSSDGRLLVSDSADGTVRLWDVQTGKMKRKLARGSGGVLVDALIDPNGRRVVSASDRSVLLWDLRTKSAEPARVLKGHQAPINSVTFSPDGRLLASTGMDSTIRLWDAGSGAQLAALRGHEGVLQARFSPDGRRLISTDINTFYLWDVDAATAHEAPQGHEGYVFSAAFGPNGDLLATSGKDRTVRLWEVGTGQQKRVLTGHEAFVINVAFRPDGKQIASVSADRTVRLWDVETGKVSGVLGGYTEALAYSPDGRHLAAGSMDFAINIWDAKTVTRVRSLEGHRRPARVVCYFPDGRTIASGGFDQTIRIWDAATGKTRRVMGGDLNTVNGLACSPDGHTVASGSDDKTLRLWDVTSGKGRVLQRGIVAGFFAFDPNGRELAGAAYFGGSSYIWDIASGRSVRLHTGNRSRSLGTAVSPDGRLVAIGSGSGGVSVLEKDTGKPFWRASALLRDPVRLLTHRGWHCLEHGKKLPTSAPAWQLSVERAHAASEAAGSSLLCIQLAKDRLEIWDKARSLKLATAQVPQLQTVVAAPGGCVTLHEDGQLRRYRPSGSFEVLIPSGTTSVDVDHGVVLAASADKKARLFPTRGAPKVAEVGAVVDAVVRWKDVLVVAYQNQTFEIVSRGTRAPLVLEGVPAERVQLMRLGPRDTLVVGFANGMVGIWDLETRRLLDHVRLHGSVSHLLIEDNKLYAATNIGNHAVLDLMALVVDRCSLLREVWNKVPMVWKDGKSVIQGPPKDHPCR